MSEMVKAKRPVSVWLSMLLLFIILGLFGAFFLAGILDPSDEATVPTFSDSGSIVWELVGLSWITCCVAGFVGMIFKLKFSRFLVAALFVTVFIWYVFTYLSDPEIVDAWSNRDLGYNVAFLVFVFSVFFPFLVLAFILAFSRKVKLFFDPSLIPQIDESTAIFHEPPPPPRFEK